LRRARDTENFQEGKKKDLPKKTTSPQERDTENSIAEDKPLRQEGKLKKEKEGALKSRGPKL